MIVPEVPPAAIRPTVLIVDDDAGVRTALHANFLRMGWTSTVAPGVRAALQLLDRTHFDLVITDVCMPDGDGLQVLEQVQQAHPGSAVILLTAHGSLPQAVESIRGGAMDYLAKPVAFEKLSAVARRVLEHSRKAIDPSPRTPADASIKQAGIIGSSPTLQASLARARAAAATGSDVLVEAESGCGKELLAKYIHEHSARARNPLVAVNCAAVPEHLIESELFGHAKGAFTGAHGLRTGKFELANGGTLLLDEIGEMPLHLQPKLLRVLQEREFERLGDTRTLRVDIRVIATTNASLAAMVEDGRFRHDLYYRLNVIPLSLPPLRERKQDIPALAKHFAHLFAVQHGTPPADIDESFVQAACAHDWPGNVREFANFMRRVLSLHPGERIDACCFEQELSVLPGRREPLTKVVAASPARIADVERLHLERTLALTGGNRTHAAEMLGVSLRTVRNKIREYNLPPRSYA